MHTTKFKIALFLKIGYPFIRTRKTQQFTRWVMLATFYWSCSACARKRTPFISYPFEFLSHSHSYKIDSRRGAAACRTDFVLALPVAFNNRIFFFGEKIREMVASLRGFVKWNFVFTQADKAVCRDNLLAAGVVRVHWLCRPSVPVRVQEPYKALQE